VLTIRHKPSDKLIDLLDKMMDYKKTITQSVRNSKRENHHKINFFCKFFGFASSIEITHSEKSGRHPHIHLLACSDEEIPIEFSKFLQTTSNRELQKSRHDITKDSYCVAIRKVEVANHQFDRQGIAEVFKYAVKFSTLEIEQLAELIHTQEVRQYRFYATT
jgi:plasmid rolling circle replication initiator protein Rep